MNYIEILEQHNKWRRDRNDINQYAMGDPTEIGKAIDEAVKQARLNEIGMTTLRQIASGKRKTKEQRLANSALYFIESLSNEKAK